jgi:hypothetical protein
MCELVLTNPEQATASLIKLDNATLFDRRVELDMMPETTKQRREFGLERDWYASNDPSISRARLREPLWSYPEDLFVPVRESRRVIVENVPAPELGNPVSTHVSVSMSYSTAST